MSQQVVTETVLLASDAALPGMLSHLTNAGADRVLFVVPPGVSLSAIDLRVLRRETVAAQRKVALVTSDPTLRTLAAREGISTFRSESWAMRGRWRRLRPDPAPRARPATPAEPEVPPAAGLFDKRSPTGFRPVAFLRAFVRRPSPAWALLGLTICLLAIFGGLLYALSIILPSATVTLAPAAEPLRVTVPVKAVQDARLDAEGGVVPAQALSVQVSGDARTQTTGRSNEPATKAKGRVVFINRTNREITVPAGTVVSTGTGNNVSFATTADLPLAPNGRAAVPVEALQPGPSGNVRAGTVTRIEGPLALTVVVANETGFTGGTTAQMGVVTEDDKVRLQAQLFEELKKQALERLNERVEGESFIPPESVSYIPLSPTFTPFVGEVSPDLYVSMSVQAVGLAVDQAAADQAAMSRLQASMPPGTRLISDTLRYTPGSVVLEGPRTVSFSVTGEGTLLRGLDDAAVRSAILGLSPEEAQTVLMERFPLARRPEIRLGPDWLPYLVPVKLPVLPWRIRVIVDWDAAAQLAMGK
jgi:hypothetical protein